jgi:hypothetical protein
LTVSANRTFTVWTHSTIYSHHASHASRSTDASPEPDLPVTKALELISEGLKSVYKGLNQRLDRVETALDLTPSAESERGRKRKASQITDEGDGEGGETTTHGHNSLSHSKLSPKVSRMLLEEGQRATASSWFTDLAKDPASHDSSPTSYLIVVRGEPTLLSSTRSFFPAQQHRVTFWVRREAIRIVSGGGRLYKDTLQKRVDELASWHEEMGLSTEGIVTRAFRHHLWICGHDHGVNNEPQPLPITRTLLLRVLYSINRETHLFDDEMTALALRAAFSLAYAMSLRMNDFTYSTFDPSKHLSRASVNMSGGWATHLTLEPSTGRPHRLGGKLPIPRDDTIRHCPAKALSRWMEATQDRPPSAPLFDFGGEPFESSKVFGYLDKALTEEVLADEGYIANRFSGYSFIRGE